MKTLTLQNKLSLKQLMTAACVLFAGFTSHAQHVQMGNSNGSIIINGQPPVQRGQMTSAIVLNPNQHVTLSPRDIDPRFGTTVYCSGNQQPLPQIYACSIMAKNGYYSILRNGYDYSNQGSNLDLAINALGQLIAQGNCTQNTTACGSVVIGGHICLQMGGVTTACWGYEQQHEVQSRLNRLRMMGACRGI
jgi:hypothetical protein